MAGPLPADLPVVADVLAEPDAVRRNQQVTTTYHVLATALAGRSPHRDLTWCAFATWASATAGRMIAMDELPRRFAADLERDEDYRSARAVAGPHAHAGVLGAAEAVAAQVSVSVSAGNTLVFAELAPLFVALVAGQDLPAGTPAPLGEAFSRYRDAETTTDPGRAADQVLAANVLAVHHEQQRLQPYIATSLDRALADVAHRLERERAVAAGVARLGAEGERAFAAAATVWDSVMTRHAMTMATPERVFDLGRDVPPLPDGSRGPAALTVLATGTARLVAAFDRTGGTLVGSAARDWADLDQRMNYIVNLFRSRQQSDVLLAPPG